MAWRPAPRGNDPLSLDRCGPWAGGLFLYVSPSKVSSYVSTSIRIAPLEKHPEASYSRSRARAEGNRF